VDRRLQNEGHGKRKRKQKPSSSRSKKKKDDDDDDDDDDYVQSLHCNKYFSQDKKERNGCISEGVSTGTPRSVLLITWQRQS
jgi:hypothetical protein